MVQKTLLELTKSILASLDSDDVDSITDTVESQQVVQIIRDTYELLSTTNELPEHAFLGALTEVSSSYPNYLKIPEDVYGVDGIRYNIRSATDTRDMWRDLTYLEPLTFVRRVQERDTSASNIEMVQDYNGVSLPVLNDAPPTYWTSFDDEYVVTDAYDSGIDTYLKTTKNSCVAMKRPEWTETDNFVPDLDSDMFPLLLAEAKDMAFAVLKQTQNGKVTQQVRDLKVMNQNDRHRLKGNPNDNYPNYGRR